MIVVDVIETNGYIETVLAIVDKCTDQRTKGMVGGRGGIGSLSKKGLTLMPRSTFAKGR